MKKEYDFSKMRELKNPYRGKKQAVGINLSPEVVDYFKGMAHETGLPYQKLIDLYLLRGCFVSSARGFGRWPRQPTCDSSRVRVELPIATIIIGSGMDPSPSFDLPG